MKTSQRVWYALLCFALLTACQPKPTIINHTEPTYPATNFDPFDNGDCPVSNSGRNCTKDSTLAILGCNEISQLPKQLRSLTPNYPMATCDVDESEKPFNLIEGQDYFYRMGGIAGIFRRYVIWKDNQFQLVKNENELQKLFAPIETSDEALSYVLTAKPLYFTYYGLTKNPKFIYEVDVLEDTHVEKIADGYALYLYDYQGFGCGLHWTSSVEVHLTIDGSIKEISKKPVFRDPAQEGECVD